MIIYINIYIYFSYNAGFCWFPKLKQRTIFNAEGERKLTYGKLVDQLLSHFLDEVGRFDEILKLM